MLDNEDGEESDYAFSRGFCCFEEGQLDSQLVEEVLEDTEDDEFYHPRPEASTKVNIQEPQPHARADEDPRSNSEFLVLNLETIPDMETLWEAAMSPKASSRRSDDNKGAGIAAFSSLSETAAPSGTASASGGPSMTLSTSTAPTSAQSPWLPPTSSRSERTVPKRPPDPLHVPEAVGLVQPSWLPYTLTGSPSPVPPTGRSSKQKSRHRWARWTARHHICGSKDNRCLPRLQRTYFDDLPNTRCQGGDYSMVPGHRSRNFDHFCLAPPHAQQRELHQRFERYPFVEAARLPTRPNTNGGDSTMSAFSSDFDAVFVDSQCMRPSSSSSEASPHLSHDASRELLPELKTPGTEEGETLAAPQEEDPLCPADEIMASKRAWAPSPNSDEKTQEQRTAPVDAPLQARRPSSQLLPERVTPGIKSAARGAEKQKSAAFDQVKDRNGELSIKRPAFDKQPSTSSQSGRSAKSNLSGFKMTGGANTPRKGEKAKKNMSRYTIFSRGGIPQFHSWASRKFGSLVRLWRCLDTHNNMHIGQGQWLRGLQDLGFSGDARELFKVLNRDQTGTLLFYHFAPEAALAVAQLLDWSRANFGSLASVGLGNAVDKRSFITRQQFTKLLTKKGFTNQAALKHTFDLIDKDGDGSVVKTEVALLDEWEFPEWLTAHPDEKAANECKEKLVAKCHGNPLFAWRQLDRTGTMRVAWHDFRQVCKKLLTHEDCELLPAVWRTFDDDLSGWLSLREFDLETYNNLLRLVTWAAESAGSFTAVFPKLSVTGHQDYRITQSEWKHCCKASGLGEAVLTMLFFGLDKDGGGNIQVGEIRFLDQWRATADIKEEEAWAELACGKQAKSPRETINQIKRERPKSPRSPPAVESSKTRGWSSAKTRSSLTFTQVVAAMAGGL